MIDSALLKARQLLADGDQLVIPTVFGVLHVLGAHLPESCDRATIVPWRCWLIRGRYPVAVCSLENLIKIKRLANRRRDAADVAQLLSAYPLHNS